MATSPMSLQQFGQTIKAKHPEYSDMADEDVANRTLAKYPQYSDMVAPSVPKPPAVDVKPLGALDAGGGWSPDDLWRGAVSGVKNVVMHPLNTAVGMAEPFLASGMAPGGMYPTTAATGRQQDSQANQAVQNAAQQDQTQQAKSIKANPAFTVGSVAGPALVTAGLTKAFKVGAPVLGEKLTNLGDMNLNDRLNLSAKDTAYGQNPAAGIRNSGITGVSTQNGLLNKIGGGKEANGALISQSVDRADANAAAPPITPQQVAPAIDGPLDRQTAVVRGPGNHAANAEAGLDVSRQKMATVAPGATSPIYGANAPSTILPSDLWKTIRNIDANTRFNPQPEIESINEVNRDIRGNLRPILEQSDPSIKPYSQNYSDLSSAETALQRQQAPYYAPHGVRAALASTLNSYPVRTAVTSGLWKVGGGLKALGTPQMGSAAGAFSPKMTPKPLQLEPSVPGNADFSSPDFTQGSTSSSNPLTPPAPPARLALPASTQTGEVQPMIGVKAPAKYPSLYEPAAKTRVSPTKFNGPPSNPLGVPKGYLNAPPKTVPPKKGLYR